MVRGGGQARLWRDYPEHHSKNAHRYHSPACGRMRPYHAVEFPLGHDYAQGGACAGCWVRGGLQAGGGDSFIRAGVGGIGGRSRRAARRAERHYNIRFQNRWQRALRKSDCKKTFFYGIDGSWPYSDGAVCRNGEETFA